jgi:hypothetical protein
MNINFSNGAMDGWMDDVNERSKWSEAKRIYTRSEFTIRHFPTPQTDSAL